MQWFQPTGLNNPWAWQKKHLKIFSLHKFQIGFTKEPGSTIYLFTISLFQILVQKSNLGPIEVSEIGSLNKDKPIEVVSFNWK